MRTCNIRSCRKGTGANMQDAKVGIIGAMDVEVAHLIHKMDDVSEEMHSGMEFHSGKLGGVDVVVSQCRVGKVNAAICAQIMIDVFGATHLINTGVAGSLDARMDIGDIVVSTDAIYHDVDVTNFGYDPGQVPGMPTAYPADEGLRRLMVSAVREAAPDINVFEGRVASGDQFVRDDSVKSRVASDFGALCCEMEGAAIAQACYLNNVPFAIIRAISDKADGSDSELYPIFEEKAARHCAKIVEHAVPHVFA